MTNGNSAERERFEKWYKQREQHDSGMITTWQHTWEGWQARAALSVCADGGKGEAVAEINVTHDGRGNTRVTWKTLKWDMPDGLYNLYAAPQAECAPRRVQCSVCGSDTLKNGNCVLCGYSGSQAECAPIKPEAKLVTFDEFVQYGLEHATSVMNGVPWAFMFNGHAVTHETDDHYLIGTPSISFRRGEVLVATAFGDNRLVQVLVLPQAECAPRADAAPRPFPDEQIAALCVAADALIERYAEPIRAILRDAEHAAPNPSDKQEAVAYLIDPGAGSAVNRFQTCKPDYLQLVDIKRRGGSVTPLYAAPLDKSAERADGLCHCGYSKETSCNIFDPTCTLRADAEKDAALKQALDALRQGKQFIANGVEFGFIRMPEPGDPALYTLPTINAAIDAILAANKEK